MKIKFDGKEGAVTYRDAFRSLWDGAKKLFSCLTATFSIVVLDSVQYVARHYIVTLVVLASFTWMFVKMAEAREERDHACVAAYRLEQSCDSLRLMIER